jgi:ABC-type uncharacterized transport system auxiliary subunit
MKRGNHELMKRSTEMSAQLAPCGDESRVFSMFAKITICMLMLAAGLAAGCGAARPSKYYQLTVPGDMAPAANANPVPITLLIGRMTGSALYREDQIVYSSGGQSMGTYEYHRWAEPPTEMIAEILLRQLRASGQYRGVYTLRSDVHGEFLLHGRLYDFKEVSGSSEVARVTMELELRNIKAGTTVWTHFYTHDEPASGKDVSAIVAALDKNVQQGIGEFRASLDQYFAAHPPAPAAQPAP